MPAVPAAPMAAVQTLLEWVVLQVLLRGDATSLTNERVSSYASTFSCTEEGARTCHFVGAIGVFGTDHGLKGCLHKCPKVYGCRPVAGRIHTQRATSSLAHGLHGALEVQQGGAPLQRRREVCVTRTGGLLVEGPIPAYPLARRSTRRASVPTGGGGRNPTC